MADKATEDLIGFVSSMGGEAVLRVEENLGEGFVRLRVAEAERRQAKHDIRCIEDVVVEMLRNSRDAGARKIFVATSCEGDTRTLVMIDDGDGVPDDMQERIFDARVTSKLETMHMDKWGVHGRGMALFSVRENVESAGVTASGAGKGAAIRVVSNTSALSERKDQSTWPTVTTNEDGERVVSRGPHNIIRTCCEFALEERGRCEVYLGSAAEIAATIRDRVRLSVSDTDLLFMDDLSSLPVVERIAAAADATELLAQCSEIGLEMSERTAHRIIAGQVAPRKSVLSQIMRDSSNEPAPIDLMRDRRGLKLSKDDLEEFRRIMERDFDFIANRYYLSLSTEPKVRVSKGSIHVTFELDKHD